MVDEEPRDPTAGFSPDDETGTPDSGATDDDVVVRVYFPRHGRGEVAAAGEDEEAELLAAGAEAPTPGAGWPPLEEDRWQPESASPATRPTQENLPTPHELEALDAFPPPAEEEPPPPAEAPGPRPRRNRFALWLSALIIIFLLGAAGVVVAVAADFLPPEVVDALPFVGGVPTAVDVTAEVADVPGVVVPLPDESPTAEPTERGDETVATLAAANAPGAPAEEETAEDLEEAGGEAAPTATTAPLPTETPSVVVSEAGLVQRGVEMVLMPGGTFEMGGGPAEPAHEVTLGPFYIDRYEVTNAAWEECVLAGACLPPVSTTNYTGEEYYGVERYAGFPVVNIDWRNADAYCRWRGSALPTEAQWEMAARVAPQTGAATVYPWGDEWNPDLLNACDASCPLDNRNTSNDDGWPQTAPVDAFEGGASPIGALNMAGNVAEWTADWFSDATYADSPAENPTGPDSGTERVVRGGAWGVANPALFDARFRSKFSPDLQGLGIGLRCAIPADQVNN